MFKDDRMMSMMTVVVVLIAVGTKDDGITLPAGETDPNTIFAAVYGNRGVYLILENLTISNFSSVPTKVPVRYSAR